MSVTCSPTLDESV